MQNARYTASGSNGQADLANGCLLAVSREAGMKSPVNFASVPKAVARDWIMLPLKLARKFECRGH